MQRSLRAAMPFVLVALLGAACGPAAASPTAVTTTVPVATAVTATTAAPAPTPPPPPTPPMSQPPSTQPAHQSLDLANLPRFVHDNFIDLSMIAMISKFRSGVGHNFSNDPDEPCRSMKHYFEPIGIDDTFWQKLRAGQVKPEDWPKVSYFAPVDGEVTDVRPATDAFGEPEVQFIFQSTDYPQVNFLFFHVRPEDGLAVGSRFTAGEPLGVVGGGSSGEIGVSVTIGDHETLVSFFELVDDDVFAEYQARGVSSMSDLIVSREERDANPLLCEPGEPGRFIGNSSTTDKAEYDDWSMGPDNWVFLH